MPLSYKMTTKTTNLKIVCRLCLKAIKDSYEVIREAYHQMIDFVTGKTLQNVLRCLMCSDCREILQKCYNFKRSCLYLNENPTMLLTVVVNCDLKMCRLCGGLVKPDSLISLNDNNFEVELIRSRLGQHLPELDILSTLDPLICNLCYNLLPYYFDFINRLSIIEKWLQGNRYQILSAKKLLKYGIHKSKDKISRLLANDGNKGDQNTVSEDSEKIEIENMKLDNIKMEDTEEYKIYSSTTSEISSMIKYEEIKIEDVDIDEKFSITFDSIQGAIQSVDESEDINLENVNLNETKKLMNENDDYIVYVDKADSFGKGKEENSEIDYRLDTVIDAIETVVRDHCVEEDESVLGEEEIEKDNVKMVKQKKKKKKGSGPPPAPKEYFPKSVLRTKIKRVNVSGQKLYQCEICQIRIKAKCSMNRHMERHRDPSEMTFFYCDNCSFKGRTKSSIACHMLSHMTTNSYKCDRCSFKTNYKYNLRHHMEHCGLKYKCEHCRFTSDRKASFVLHVGKHLRPPRCKPKPRIYKCDKCPCTTKSQSGIYSHKKSHKDLSEVDIYKCSLCSYESRHRKRVTEHMQQHGEYISCKYCHFRTKYRKTMKRHIWRVHANNFGNASVQTE